MNRYRTYGSLDDAPEILGDAGFTKLDMLTDPALLGEGVLAVSENLRFDSNGTTVRGGMSRKFPAGTVPQLSFGCCVYKPTSGEDYMAFATGYYLVLFNIATQSFQYVNYPTGETIEDSDKVDMVQAGVGAGSLPAIYILRGLGKDVLVFDAAANSISVATGFARGEFALFYQDRMAVGAGQAVPVSDFLDFTTFNTLNQFQILKGGNDYLQAFVAYQKDYVLIGSRQRWFVAFFDPQISATVGAGYDGGVQDNSFVRLLTSEAGPIGPRAVLEAMGMVWFITGGAIYAFQPQLDNELTVLGKPISAGIQPIMDRMSVKYAGRACIERKGYRLYFAMPISDEILATTAVTAEEKTIVGLALPFTLPAVLSTDAVATITTAAENNLAVGDKVQLEQSVDPALNGEFSVFSVVDNFTFKIRLNIASASTIGNRLTVQKLATRNNMVAIYNLNTRDWESVDILPPGFYADWLRSVEQASARQLMLIDADAGAFIYEGAEQDEVGDVSGGILLPCTLPITLSAFNFSAKPVPGRLVTRCYRWGMQPRKVSKAEARGTFDADSAATMTLTARTPNNRVWSSSRDFTRSEFSVNDVALRKRCGERALEAQVEITTSGGRPTVRSVAVETINVGRVEE